MTPKIGRNDPCPCGSGKKYKHCCGKPAAPAAPPAESPKGVIVRTLAWLAQYHRKAFATALHDAMVAAGRVHFDNEDVALDALAGLTETVRNSININLTEWLLAEGRILVKGEKQRVADLLLGPDGPRLTAGQRAWLAQLARRPLRLYDVAEVEPGVGLTVRDALDADQPPLVVDEREGSWALKVGVQLAARVMEVNGRQEFSGAVYPFDAENGRAVQARLRELAALPDPHQDEGMSSASLAIISGWLRQHFFPQQALPKFVDEYSGEPLVFTADHYDVRDWDALTAALAAQPDVEGDREEGWERLREGEDGHTRPEALLETLLGAEPFGQRVSVIYNTPRLAEQGRAWFEALAGDAVKFDVRKVSSPTELLFNMGKLAPPTIAPQGFDAGALTDAIENIIRRSYANWADEPIPALHGCTPRQAIQSASGLERIKGLLRSYEDAEAQQASQQGRREISYQFLWDALGLRR